MSQPKLLLLVFALFGSVYSLQEYRLPEAIVPEHYDLTIMTYLDEKDNFTFTGTVEIKLRANNETNSIVLHSKDLDIVENGISVISISDKNDVMQLSNINYDKDVDFLTINSNQPLKRGQQYSLKIPFKGFLLGGLVGFYKSSYTNNAGNNEWLAITQFEANHARRAFPCFDEPAFKATFSINLGRKEELSTISNMPMLESKRIENMNGWYLDKYEKTVPMSTYLVAYMVSKFKSVTSPKTNEKWYFRVWAREEAVNQTHYAAEIGPKILTHYEQYFDVPYPLPKQDMIAVPDFAAGAMENWGIITYRETALLYQPNISSTSNKYRVASVVAHELAHQWFGNLVTMKWWTDLWLNEGFATYVSTIGVDHCHPDWNVLMEEAVDNTVDVFRLDSLNTSHPVSVPIGHPNEIDQIFDAISYKKGSAIIRMMSSFLGEDVFRKGVSSYLKKYAYKNAEQDDLWESLTKAAYEANALPSDITVKQIMDSWTKQTGYPLINIQRNYEQNSAVITQLRYESSSTLSSSQKWWIPLTYTVQGGMSKDHRSVDWMRQTQTAELKNLAPSNSWVLFNTNMSALYRVNYDNANWELLISALRKPEHDGIATLNRFQLIIDSMDFAWTGQLDYDVALRLMRYVGQEKEYIPWRGAFIGLGRINSILRRSPEYGVFKKFIRMLVTPIFHEIGGLNQKVISTPGKLDAVKHQILISTWACKADVPSCKRNALQLFYKWMKTKNPDSSNEVPSDLRREVYCTGINKGGEAEWEFLWNRYLSSNVASEKDLILRSLGCTTEVWILIRYLEWTILENSGIRRQDAYSVFDKIGSSSVGYFVAKKFLFERVADIRKYHNSRPSVMGRYVETIASQISSQNEFDEFLIWVEKNEKLLKEGNIVIKQALESTTIRLNWIKNHQKEVVDVLKDITK